MRFSDLGSRFAGGTGTGSLMRDLARLPELPVGHAGVCRLGGGNPALLPAVMNHYRQALSELAESQTRFANTFGRYAAQHGDPAFIDALCRVLQDEHGLPVGPENVLLTNGSQNGFIQLFNLFGGRADKGSRRHRILLPLAPEYIGYGDLSLGDELFVSRRPTIDCFAPSRFKYGLNLDGLDTLEDLALEPDEHIGALCVSRPTNPTGNVLTDAEVSALVTLAEQRDLPLIMDNAYGAPFPDIIHVPAQLPDSPNVVLSMSLSKLGLPGVRAGIIVANADLIAALVEMNTVMNLAPVSIGPAMLAPLLASGQLAELTREHIRPWYRARATQVLAQFDALFHDLPVRAHAHEGAIFLWLWFEGLPISTQAFYKRLHADGVVVVSGHHFFPGLAEDPHAPWQHRHECLRISFAGEESEVMRGMEVISAHAHQLYDQAG